MTETLDDVLNKIEAIFDCKAGTPTELADYMHRRKQRIWEYVKARKHTPGVNDYLAMKAWVAKMTIRIAAVGRKLQTQYKQAYQAVCAKRKAR